MTRMLSNEDLAKKLEEQQVDRVILNEAARRIRQCDLRELLRTNEIVEAIQQSSLIDQRTVEIVEQIVSSVKAPRRSSSRLSSKAARILRGESYDDRDVRSLAASVLSQDETTGQS